MLPPGEYKREVGWTCHRDSAFCQITLVFVSLPSVTHLCVAVVSVGAHTEAGDCV